MQHAGAKAENANVVNNQAVPDMKGNRIRHQRMASRNKAVDPSTTAAAAPEVLEPAEKLPNKYKVPLIAFLLSIVGTSHTDLS